MLKNIGIVVAFSIATIAMGSMARAATISVEEKISMQATMLQHIDRMTIDGVIPHVSLKDGTVVDLVPTKSHPMVLSFDDKFVLCTDFRDPEGKFVNIDFFLTKSAGEYVVFQTEINNREPLRQLIKSGKVVKLD